jgi:hypothetical protein
MKPVNITILASPILYKEINNKLLYYALALVTAERKLTLTHQLHATEPWTKSRRLLENYSHLKRPLLLSALHIC